MFRFITERTKQLLTSGIVAVAVLLTAASTSLVRVSSISMKDTLCPGDYLIATGVGLLRPLRPMTIRHGIRRGGLVIIEKNDPDHPSKPPAWMVKRVIAVGGDLVRIHSGVLYVNNARVAEPYVRHNATYGPQEDSWPVEPEGDGVRNVRIPRGSLFVLGDSRDDSLDSRETGSVKATHIIGVVVEHFRPPGSAQACG